MPGGALLLVCLLGGTLKEIPDVYRMASPLVHAGKHCPPTLQIFDEQDFVINASHGRRLHQALQEVGATSVYIEIRILFMASINTLAFRGASHRLHSLLHMI